MMLCLMSQSTAVQEIIKDCRSFNLVFYLSPGRLVLTNGAANA